MSWLTPPPQEASLKAHLLYWFTLCVVGSLVVAEAIALGFIGGSLASLTSTASNLLTTQASNALASSIVSNSAQLFEDVLNNILTGVTTTAVATGDTFRADYTTGPELSFYGMPSYLDKPVVQPATAKQFPGMTISKTHSVWILADSVSATPPALNVDQQDALNKVAHVDLFMRPIHERNQEIMSLQVGLENGLFKSYPGTGDNLSQGPYDPRTRPWYLASKKNQATNSSFTVTDPFLSAFGRGWLITTTKACYSKNDGSFIGVVAAQSQLSVFSNLLASHSNGNSVSLFIADTSGSMLASTSISFNATDPGTAPYSYVNSSNPTISSAFWHNTILPSANPSIDTQSSAYGSATYTDPVTNVPYLVLWKTLSIYNSDAAAKSKTPSWIAVGAVPISNIQATVAAATSNLQQSLPFSIGISVALFVGTLVTVLVLVSFFARQIVGPLAKLSDESTRVSNNIGAKDLWEGVGSSSATVDSGVDEMNLFQESFYNMVRSVQSGRNKEMNKEMGDNSVFLVKNGELPEWEATIRDFRNGESRVRRIELLPNSPPQYKEANQAKPSDLPAANASSFLSAS
ncbi:UNVERIFIED_CONTAM: hypothetical protein HDU68_000693 [Siphonaria sp. JEL0065]|nr:hypothetical protein HDU68_000693 [Siphonaria sp. JEL0065]